MQISELIKQLNDQGIFVYVEDHKLKTRSNEIITDEQIKSLIRQNKQGIIEYLSLNSDNVSSDQDEIKLLSRDAIDFALSPAQQRLWFTEQFEGASKRAGEAKHKEEGERKSVGANLTLPIFVKLTGQLNIAALNSAIHSVIERHEILRTSIVEKGGVAFQRIHPDAKLEMASEDVLDDTQLQRIYDEERNYRFDLTANTLFRVRLLHLNFVEDKQKHVLILSMHHLIADGWSIRILLQEIVALYNAFRNKLPSPLNPLAIQYVDYAAWQQQFSTSQSIEPLLEYWEQSLTGYPSLNLPHDQQLPSTRQFSGSSMSITLSDKSTESLVTLCKEQELTLFSGLLSVLSLVMHLWTNDSKFVIGTVVSGRSSAELEPLVGCFMNYLPIPVELLPDTDIKAWMTSIQSTVLSAFDHQTCPFEQIVNRMQPKRGEVQNPLFNVLLVLQNFGLDQLLEQTEVNSDLTIEPFQLAPDSAQLDLRFVVTQQKERINVTCEFSDELFNASTIKLLLQAFDSVLTSLAAPQDAHPADFALPAALEVQALASAKRLTSSQSHNHKHQMIISGTFTTEPLDTPLRFWGQTLDLGIETVFAPYNQVFQQLLDDNSLINKNPSGYNVLFIRWEDWLKAENGANEDENAQQQLNRIFTEFTQALKKSSQKSRIRNATSIVFFCPVSEQISKDSELLNFCWQNEKALEKATEEVSNIKVICSTMVTEYYPVEQFHDAYSDTVGHVPFSDEGYTAFATLLWRRIYTLHSCPCKLVLVTDAHLIPLLPAFIKDSALAVSPADDISELISKSDCAQDECVFIDNDPVRCQAIRQNAPGVKVIELKEAIESSKPILQHIWGLEAGAVEVGAPERKSRYNNPEIIENIAQELSSIEQIMLAASRLQKASSSNELENRAYVTPEGEIEVQLAQIWQDLLNLDPEVQRIGSTDDFFSLGGHSLLATRLVSSIRKIWSVEVTLKQVFNAPQLKDLAHEIQQLSGDKSIDSAIAPVSREQMLGLSYAQQRLWFFDQAEGGSPQYNMPVALKLTGQLDDKVLQLALTEMVKRHEILRTTYSAIGGQGQQIISPPSPVTVRRLGPLDVPGGALEVQVKSLMQQEAGLAFDLTKQWPLRITLVTMPRIEDKNQHLLLFTIHHIASDGWSMGCLVKEFVSIYSAFVKGQPNPLPPLTVQYADFTYWQKDLLTTENYAKQLEYWQQRLEGLPQVHNIPLDKPRPVNQSFIGDSVKHVIDSKLLDELKQLGQAQGASLFMVLQSAFALLLSRISGETDIVMSCSTAGRTNKALENLIGFFVNTLVFRSDLSASTDFQSLLVESRKHALDAFANQEVPFGVLVDQLKPDRSVSHAPLCQLSFVLHNQEQVHMELPGLSVERVELVDDVARLDLELHAVQTDEGLSFTWLFARDLFEVSSIRAMAACFEVLLRDIVSSPHKALRDLKLMTSAQEQHLVKSQETSIDTSLGAPSKSSNSLCLHQVFEAQVSLYPEQIAVAYGNTSITYQVLNERANQLAHYLIEQGLKADDLVCLYVERSIEMVIGLLGILKAGGAYVPIDPSDPPTRVEYVLMDCGANVVLTTSVLMNELSMKSQKVVLLDNPMFDAFVGKMPVENVTSTEQSVHVDNLAYVVYTSGSTGKPKGVMIEHHSVVHHIEQAVRAYGIDESDVILQFNTLSFDAATEQVFSALTSGAMLQLRPQELWSESEFRNWVVQNNVTTLDLPPSYAAQVLPGLFTDPSFWNEGSLKRIIIGGESFPLKVSNSWFGNTLIKNCRLFNAYGPTEACITSHLFELITSDNVYNSIPLGKAVDQTPFYILDSHLTLVPDGVVGELYIGGERLARGYLNQLQLSAEKFIQWSFDDESGERSGKTIRLYKTGDLVRRTAKGQLVFVGRVDDQIKIRGFRIELGEIEAALIKHPEVKDARVLLQNIDNATPHLAAFVVVNSEGDDASLTNRLREHLKKHVPGYMVPAAYAFLDNLPLTSGGKLDHRLLPVPIFQSMDAFALPETQTEVVMVRLWKNVLNIETLGIDDNFFEIGGNSLMAVQLVNEIRDEFALEVEVNEVFLAKTARVFSAVIDEIQAGNSLRELVSVEASDGDDDLYEL